MNPQLTEDPETLDFDSSFESGNLDIAVLTSQTDHYYKEYDLYMRCDTNTRGHHQWFYFSVKNQSYKPTVKFTIVNFTKKASLYTQGMRVNIWSKQENKHNPYQNNSQQAQFQKRQMEENEGWTKGGENF
jgi:hypothetical protein